MSGALAFAIFIATLVVVIWRPRGLSIGWTAMSGAIVALLTGVVHWRDVWTVTTIVWDATFAFIGIIIFSTVLDKIGFFEWAALHMARLAKGDGRRLFILVSLLGAAVSALFTNDGAALILTPIVLEKMHLLKFDLRRTIPFVLASGFIADSASLPLVVSNLVNIVTADYFHIGFLHYLLHMIVPYFVSVGISLLMFMLLFYREIPSTYDVRMLRPPGEAIRHRGMFVISWVLLGVLSAGYIVTDLLHIPVSFMTALIAIVFLCSARWTNVLRPWPILRNAPWSIVFFSIGMYVVVFGLQNVGLTHVLTKLISVLSAHGTWMGVFATGLVMAFVSSVMNNLPSVMIGAISVHGLHHLPWLQEMYVYANVIGCDLGPKMTPLGSLATLLWLHVLAQKGVRIRVWTYCKTGFLLTVPTLVATLASLYGWGLLLH
ncbi:arsenic transporter [Alicyclobacillus fodiniaquatilis]|jgi:arsenical pump membrane protein|uniref:Arsenical pump membrane protein n=1 Tax=Alicyclobacillus fodiniaquatilis TaxID=1661150 RepID=A0ABW4JAB4_9BACL